MRFLLAGAAVLALVAAAAVAYDPINADQPRPRPATYETGTWHPTMDYPGGAAEGDTAGTNGDSDQ